MGRICSGGLLLLTYCLTKKNFNEPSESTTDFQSCPSVPERHAHFSVCVWMRAKVSSLLDIGYASHHHRVRQVTLFSFLLTLMYSIEKRWEVEKEKTVLASTLWSFTTWGPELIVPHFPLLLYFIPPFLFKKESVGNAAGFSTVGDLFFFFG